MLHLKLHTTSTTGHVVVTVISVGHWQFCRRVFATGLILLPLDLAFVLILSGWVALRAALGGFWQELPRARKKSTCMLLMQRSCPRKKKQQHVVVQVIMA